MDFYFISLGKFRFPKEIAVKCAVEGVLSWRELHPDSDIQITFACTVPDLFELVKDAMEKVNCFGTEF